MIKKLIFWILCCVVSNSSFLVRDDFLFCKISNKIIDPASACKYFTLGEKDCQYLEEHLSTLDESNFVVLDEKNKLMKTVFYNLNKHELYSCNCSLIKEIEIADEIEKIGNLCIKDLLVRFNEINAFLTRNGIIREKTSSVLCDNTERYFHSITNKTELVQFNNKVNYKQWISDKQEIDFHLQGKNHNTKI